MKDFFDLCAARYSLRQFAGRPVERENIVKCLEAARLAPSASNGQPCRFVVFDDQAKKQRLCDAVFGGIYSPSQKFARAPVIVALLVTTGSMIDRLGNAVQGTAFQLIDAGIAGEHFVLQAQELGLGTCWIGWYDSKALIRFLEVSTAGRRSPSATRRAGGTADERREAQTGEFTEPQGSRKNRRAESGERHMVRGLRPVCLIAVGYPSEQSKRANADHRTLNETWRSHNTECGATEPGHGQVQTNATWRSSRRKELNEIAWWNP